MEFWTTTVGVPGTDARAARAAEAQAWDGLGVSYAPTMTPDAYPRPTAAQAKGAELRCDRLLIEPVEVG
jgi:hypothetical protein